MSSEYRLPSNEERVPPARYAEELLFPDSKLIIWY
jgi:hypothetical protein